MQSGNASSHAVVRRSNWMAGGEALMQLERAGGHDVRYCINLLRLPPAPLLSGYAAKAGTGITDSIARMPGIGALEEREPQCRILSAIAPWQQDEVWVRVTALARCAQKSVSGLWVV